jgi:hypothetical protein
MVWHILEVVVNGLMVIEVTTRWVAYGKVSICLLHQTVCRPIEVGLMVSQKYPMTPLNIVDLLLVLFCSITLILVFRSPCSEGTRGK